jgi:hypothetical protein
MTRRKTYDPNDPEQVEVRQREQTLAVVQARADWNWMLGDPRGRRILAGLLASFRFNASSYVPGDALATAYNEGARSCSAAIYATITQTGHDALVDILRELAAIDG